MKAIDVILFLDIFENSKIVSYFLSNSDKKNIQKVIDADIATHTNDKKSPSLKVVDISTLSISYLEKNNVLSNYFLLEEKEVEEATEKFMVSKAHEIEKINNL